MWVKRLPSLLDDCLQVAKRAIKTFDEENPADIPLRYIYECRQKLLHKRNILKYMNNYSYKKTRYDEKLTDEVNFSIMIIL